MNDQNDDDYVLEEDESYPFLIRRKLEEGLEASREFLDSVQERAKEYFSDPDNRERVIEEGTKIIGILSGWVDKKTRRKMRVVKDQKDLKPGDILGVSRGMYEHYAVYIGNGEVIHYAAETSDFRGGAAIRRAPFQNFLGTAKSYFVVCFPEDIFCFSAEETVRRAEEKLGETKYSLISNNCEHFAIWCKTGCTESQQVETAIQKITEIITVVVDNS